MDSVVWDMVTNALQAPEDEEWTRMVAGIVKGKLFYDENDVDKDVSEYEALLQKNNDRIMQQTVQSCANTTSKPCEETYYYAPIRYHLLDPPMLQQCFSELYDYDHKQHHFTPNMDCELLLVDSKAEQIRAAEEESKESQERKNRTMEEKKKLNGQQQPSIGDGRGSMSKLPSALIVRQQRGEKSSSNASNAKSVSTSQGSGGNTTSFLRTGLGRGRLATVSSSSSSTAAAAASGNATSRGLGRGMSAVAKAALLQRDKSRGIGSSTVPSATRTNSTTIPTTTSVVVASSTTISSSHNPIVSDTATTAAVLPHPPPVRGRAAALLAMSSKSRNAKMKVLDAEESKQNLIRIQEANTSIEDSRAQRKRKLMEEAEARGLKKSSGIKKI
jgi:hypothetical protein